MHMLPAWPSFCMRRRTFVWCLLLQAWLQGEFSVETAREVVQASRYGGGL